MPVIWLSHGTPRAIEINELHKQEASLLDGLARVEREIVNAVRALFVRSSDSIRRSLRCIGTLPTVQIAKRTRRVRPYSASITCDNTTANADSDYLVPLLHTVHSWRCDSRSSIATLSAVLKWSSMLDSPACSMTAEHSRANSASI